MNILIPMAGAGKRFSDAGYTKNKAIIPTIDRKSLQEHPMVVCAVSDLPYIHDVNTNIIFVDREFHCREGVEEVIKFYYPNSEFITIDYLTEGQACTCLLAKDKIDNEEELIISACDNGISFDMDAFREVKQSSDVIVFTFTENESAKENPSAYGWVMVDNDEDMNCKGCSVKKAISDHPERDHAIIATFWYRHGSDFVKAAEQMIKADDRINNEFYVDNVLNYNLKHNLRVKAFDVERYLCWGMPRDYENYQSTVRYWSNFIKQVVTVQ